VSARGIPAGIILSTFFAIGGYFVFLLTCEPNARHREERACFCSTILLKKGKSIEILLGRECATKIFVRLLGFDADGGKGSERNMDGGGSVLVKTTFMASVA
jgi:hypothetical protein